ncbi:hypothetical protein ACWKT5_21875 [Streptomyces avermitilis]
MFHLPVPALIAVLVTAAAITIAFLAVETGGALTETQAASCAPRRRLSRTWRSASAPPSSARTRRSPPSAPA